MKKLSTLNSQLSTQRGFTLIELLLAIVIIGILATIIVVNFINVRARARDTQRKSDLKQIQAALELYRQDQGSYPSTNGISCGAAFTGGTATYMTKIPCDPVNSGQLKYNYISPWLTGPGTYALFTCLENLNDPQKDTGNVGTFCNGTTNWSYGLGSP